MIEWLDIHFHFSVRIVIRHTYILFFSTRYIVYILLAIYICRYIDADTARSYTHGVFSNSRFTYLKPIDHISGSIFFLLSPAKIDMADPHMGKRQLFTDLVEVSARYPEIQIASSSNPSSSSSSPVKEDIGTA